MKRVNEKSHCLEVYRLIKGKKQRVAIPFSNPNFFLFPFKLQVVEPIKKLYICDPSTLFHQLIIQTGRRRDTYPFHSIHSLIHFSLVLQFPIGPVRAGILTNHF
jgi:hypothetical protein